MDNSIPNLAACLSLSPRPFGPSTILASNTCPSPRLFFPSRSDVMVLSMRTFKFPAHHILAPSFFDTAIYLPEYVLEGPEQP